MTPAEKEIQAYIDKQPYYGYCTTEYKEGIEQGAKWMMEKLNQQNKELREEIDNTIKNLQHKHDSFIGSLTDQISMAESKGFKQGLSWAIGSFEEIKHLK